MTIAPDLFSTDESIQDRFDAWDAAHPECFALFKKYAEQLLAAGRTRFGSDAIMQRIRWESAINPSHDGGFKLNDNFSSRYARKLMNEDARFADFFTTRRLKVA